MLYIEVRLVLESGSYFFQHCWWCGENLIAVSNRERYLIEQIRYAQSTFYSMVVDLQLESCRSSDQLCNCIVKGLEKELTTYKRQLSEVDMQGKVHSI